MMDKLAQLTEIKRIASVMEEKSMGSGPGFFVVTSPFVGEGKSLMATGLAMHRAVNLSGKVLLADFNWRTPRLHELFNRKQNFSFQDLKSSDDPLEYVQRTNYTGLELLTAPKSKDCDQFSDSLDICRSILTNAQKTYDRVIVDTCSMFPANRFMLDPVRLARDAAGTMLVFMAGVTPRDMAKKAVSIFKEYELSLTGILMNDFRNPMHGRA
ncbi:tyrosine-protein kinase family protein [Desulfonatronovibrio magnus]|uniref:tyrosine-protein kinase family protein n=1 Tax=Desulfonatronovibrio magnus TaxID=698827 RepID=UPI0005EB7262|nr:tyrosine-protein kinase family protein [Desulfonatronovibrio magnus]